MKKFIFLIPILLLIFFPYKTLAKEINVTGSYGLTMCTEVVTGAGSSQYVDCAYQTSQQINNTSTVYTILPKAVESFDGSTQNYYIANRLWFFAYYDFKKDNYYTLNFSFNNGSYIYNNMSSYNSFSDLTYGYFLNNDYIQNDGLTLTGYSVNYNSSEFDGTISITFKATENTSSYRFWVDGSPLLRNKSFTNNQGYRVYLLSAFEEQNNDSALLQQITNQNNTMINQNQQIINNGNITNDFLTDDTPPESDISVLGNVQGLLPPGPVDSLLNIPFKFLSIIVSSLGDNCKPLSINWVFDKTLTLSCFSDSFYNKVPSGLMLFINLIPSGFILINYFKHLYKKVNRAVSLETTSDDEWGVL